MSRHTQPEAERTAVRDIVAESCAALSIPADADAVDQLVAYVGEVVRWNRRVNLTGAPSAERFASGPLFDAMTLLPVLDRFTALVDVGSGGGLPGIPVRILRRAGAVTLVEPRAKRVAFLNHALAHLGLDAGIAASRLSALTRAAYDAAVAQAVFEPMEWIRQGRGLLCPGGRLYVLTSAPLPATLPDGGTAEAVFECSRGSGRTPRFSYRVRFE